MARLVSPCRGVLRCAWFASSRQWQGEFRLSGDGVTMGQWDMKHGALKGSFCPTCIADFLAQHLASTVHCNHTFHRGQGGCLGGIIKSCLVSCCLPLPWQELGSHVLNICNMWWTWRRCLGRQECEKWRSWALPWGAEVSRAPQEYLRTGRLMMFSISIAVRFPRLPPSFPCRPVKKCTVLEVHESFAQQILSLLSQYNILESFLGACYVPP